MADVRCGEWARHPASLAAVAYRDAWDQAEGRPPATYPRLLTAAEDGAWWAGWRAGLVARRRAAGAAELERERAIIRAAHVAVGEYLAAHPGMQRWADDLLADACLGATMAAGRYDPAGGVSLFSWALRRARGSVADGVRQRAATPGRGVSRAQHARGLTLANLPAHRQPAAPLEQLRAAGLDIALEEDFTDHVTDRLLVEHLLAGCSARQRFILTATLLHGRTVSDVARQLGVHPTAVRKALDRCLVRLRQQHADSAVAV